RRRAAGERERERRAAPPHGSFLTLIARRSACYRAHVRFAPRRLALLALLVAAGCPRPPAVAAGRLDEAYNWMSADYRKTHDRAAFERALGDRRGAEKLRGARVELEA